MNTWLNNAVFFSLTFFAVSTHAQSSYELACRSKAKEIATKTYSSCITESRNAEVERIRKEYQKQLEDLKARYDKELKNMGGKNLTSKASSKAAKSTPVVNSTSAPKATKGVAKTLPTRKESSPALPLHEIQEDTSVVTPDAGFYGNESESSQNDTQGDLSIQLVPVNSSGDQIY